MNDILKEICNKKKEQLIKIKSMCSYKSLEKLILNKGNRGFKNLLTMAQIKQSNNIIAEIKKASPSAGLIINNYIPEKIAILYEKSGIEPEQYTQYVNPPYFHLCHGLGLSASEPPLVRITDDTMLEPGMTFSVEAYLKGPDILYGSEEDVLITDSGCELLSDPDTGLYVIE